MIAERRVRAARPRAPWGSFPLSELVVLAGLGLAGLAIAWWGQERGLWVIAGAVALGSLAGLEVAIREHFAGYRPHAGLLAGTVAFAVSVPAALIAGLDAPWVAATTAASFAPTFAGLRRAWGRRARTS